MWKTIYKELPSDGSTVWIRVLHIYGELTLATFNESNQTFTVNLTGVVIPLYFVARWKNQ